MQRLFSILLFLVTISCASPYPEAPRTVAPIQPTYTPRPSVIPANPSLPPGYEYVNDGYVDLSFALPEGWSNETANDPGGLISIYYLPYPGTDSLFRIVKYPVNSDVATSKDLLEYFKLYLETQGVTHLNVNDEYEVTISGQPAAVIEYYIQYPLPDSFLEAFSVFVTVVGTDNRGYILQWSAKSDDEQEIKKIFKEMLPFIKFLSSNPIKPPSTIHPTVVNGSYNPNLPADCISWSEITLDDVGQKMCVWGPVKYISHDQDALYLGFGNHKGDFYILAYGGVGTDVRIGDCVRIIDEVKQLGASPVIVWDHGDDIYGWDC